MDNLMIFLIKISKNITVEPLFKNYDSRFIHR
jgi:hypothetical protein